VDPFVCDILRCSLNRKKSI
ncbi:hypothetical protein TNCT_573601, partial [Trichonephila clavata]